MHLFVSFVPFVDTNLPTSGPRPQSNLRDAMDKRDIERRIHILTHSGDLLEQLAGELAGKIRGRIAGSRLSCAAAFENLLQADLRPVDLCQLLINLAQRIERLEPKGVLSGAACGRRREGDRPA